MSREIGAEASSWLVMGEKSFQRRAIAGRQGARERT